MIVTHMIFVEVPGDVLVLQVIDEMTEVRGRVLPAPAIQYGGTVSICFVHLHKLYEPSVYFSDCFTYELNKQKSVLNSLGFISLCSILSDNSLIFYLSNK